MVEKFQKLPPMETYINYIQLFIACTKIAMINLFSALCSRPRDNMHLANVCISTFPLILKLKWLHSFLRHGIV